MSDIVFCMSYSSFGALLSSCKWTIVSRKVSDAPLGMYENVLSYKDLTIKRRYFVNPYVGVLENDDPALERLPYPEYRRFVFTRADLEVMVIGSSYFDEHFAKLACDAFGMIGCSKDQVRCQTVQEEDLSEDAVLLCALDSEPVCEPAGQQADLK